MIINAGLNRYVCNDKDEGILEYNIKDWVNDWQNIEDLSKDKEKYETDYSNKKEYNLKT
jgi:hypothetical protein